MEDQTVTPVLPESSPVVGQADKSLRTAISFAQIMVAVFTMLSLVGGLILCFTTATEEVEGLFLTRSEESYPYVGLGLGTMLVALLLCAFGVLAITYAKWRLEHATWLDRHRV